MESMEPLNIVDNADQMENNIGKAEYYIQQLNVKNAKKIALCLVIGFICYHGLIHLRYGSYNIIIDLNVFYIVFNFSSIF